jgi:hypothetical protein
MEGFFVTYLMYVAMTILDREIHPADPVVPEPNPFEVR